MRTKTLQKHSKTQVPLGLPARPKPLAFARARTTRREEAGGALSRACHRSAHLTIRIDAGSISTMKEENRLSQEVPCQEYWYGEGGGTKDSRKHATARIVKAQLAAPRPPVLLRHPILDGQRHRHRSELWSAARRGNATIRIPAQRQHVDALLVERRVVDDGLQWLRRRRYRLHGRVGARGRDIYKRYAWSQTRVLEY